MNYTEILQTGLPLINEWLNKQPEYITEKEEFKELQRVIKEIEEEQDFSKQSYLDIQFILKPFQEILPLKLKRIFNVSTMDQYTMFISSRYFETIDDHINLILSTSKYNQNLTKFFYNPISLTLKTREFFTYLRTLYIYTTEDEMFENDSKIIAREFIKNKKYNLYINQMKQLEEWTKLKFGEILFD